ncbi:MAG: hypothetical protein L3J67_12345 [Hyphomicrobiaceae bacterium]|nr:hypothetical protein [Hyphomicrobiaceae bacterium]
MWNDHKRRKVFKSEQTRLWTTDFLIGIGMFTLVAFFASTQSNAALPAPLAKTQAIVEANQSSAAYEQSVLRVQFVSTQNSANPKFFANKETGDKNNSMLIFMALIFSALLTLTIQFWRNLRRAYASPRRKWGKG